MRFPLGSTVRFGEFPELTAIQDHPLRLLKRLNQTVQQKPVETTVAKSDTILVMLAESVHGPLLCGEIPGV
jgi:hypothetical protein